MEMEKGGHSRLPCGQHLALPQSCAASWARKLWWRSRKTKERRLKSCLKKKSQRALQLQKRCSLGQQLWALQAWINFAPRCASLKRCVTEMALGVM